ncbi:hypothetical protein ACLB2K_033274 [Fragaria x ananassa]
MKDLAQSVQEVLWDVPPIPECEATCALFYSISSTQPGLSGINLGKFLIKRVITLVRKDMPHISVSGTSPPSPRDSRVGTWRLGTMPPTPGYRVKASQEFYFVPPRDHFPARDWRRVSAGISEIATVYVREVEFLCGGVQRIRLFLG